ncbi:MAG: DUF481 domain-containing protein [Xanthomonadales bacterium]|nr:DUF481 domain-containing protein [Xanthomonadales bacterium]
MKLRNIFLLIFLMLVSLTSYANEKTDIVILKNGDRITGEVKSLEAGLLQLKTDTMGTVNIEWRFISELISGATQRVESTDGRRWLGNLHKPAEGDHIVVNTQDGPVDLSPDEVVTVWPVAATFLDKVDLDMSVGFDYSKSTDITNFNLSIDFLHRGDERLTESSLRSDITRQQSGDDQNRQDFRLSQQFLRPEQKFRTWLVGLDANDALGVDLRLYAGGAIGKYYIKTNYKWFSVSGGLLATQENPEKADSENNIEGILSARYRYFRYATPERTFDTSLAVFPSVTDFGRIRTNFRSTFKLEFIEDLFWSMEFYATHDNQPLSEDAEKLDYGIITAIGWSY